MSEVRPAKAQGAAVRFLLRAFLVLFTALAGFAAAAAIASAFVISRDAGLAGAAEAVVYGAAGALVAAVLAAIALRRTSARVLSGLSLAAAVLLVVLLAWVLWNQQAAEDVPPSSPVPPATTAEPQP